MTRRAVLLLALASVISTPDEGALAAEPTSVTWGRDPKDPRWVQGQALVRTAPADVWTRIQRVDDWPRMFSDIKWLRVVERSPDHWRVRLESKTMTCGAHDYHVRFQPSRSGKVVIDAPGTTSIAYFRVFDGKTRLRAVQQVQRTRPAVADSRAHRGRARYRNAF